MKILVTGANGYLGRGVVKCLVNDGIEVVATDFSCNNSDCTNFKCCDLFSIDNPYEFFEKPDVLFHMAWKNGFEHGNISHINDLPRHYAFIQKMAESGIKRIAVMGSMHEIGFYEGSINENTPTKPESLYGVSKDALRKLTELICRKNNVEFQWLRGFYIYSNDINGCSIFSKIAKAEAEGEKMFPFTSGENQWDFLSYEDFCIQASSAVEQNTINGIINICNGKPEKLSYRVERFISENNYKIKLDYGKYPDRPYDSKAIWGDDRLIRQILENKKK